MAFIHHTVHYDLSLESAEKREQGARAILDIVQGHIIDRLNARANIQNIPVDERNYSETVNSCNTLKIKKLAALVKLELVYLMALQGLLYAQLIKLKIIDHIENEQNPSENGTPREPKNTLN